MATEEEQYDDLALKIAETYSELPAITVGELSNILEVDPRVVAEILDSYEVTADGPIWRGTGQGGGWVHPVETASEPTHIGYRWPDGALREDAFDIDNEQHREMMGI